MFSSTPRAVLTAGMIAVLVATGGGAVATAQPSAIPATPTSSAPTALQQQAPAPVDPCAITHGTDHHDHDHGTVHHHTGDADFLRRSAGTGPGHLAGTHDSVRGTECRGRTDTRPGEHDRTDHLEPDSERGGHRAYPDR
ncbi:hypothetical protein HQ305_06790 [Rhodococcus sp. BP-149]|uniref:hypothetical protein n=1 Tax=unclassified Rhodococcus (in: high G+C Gram-positive bacteria) TaxID=192944 RepID=UPI001C9A7083|nr:MULTISPECIES: hypothetical protein [unclassified Rhodococcus (in: high G+C Gram-positive bacteria)]MBY6683989.1 hypothetical protein [Rhodococcus sp. BP-288]MBY6693350.1 hypothetical protein [Rhodococcus sp. BP-188]MBY6697547.1 hypothetical protein [Rhodococcus sp. BP-285]MBY6702224.1 hypothetical protein [Rhodococcus sp. BP-283]MBY6709843.1 hypothetical protein [Rhodococcus sp. BP-160]